MATINISANVDQASKHLKAVARQIPFAASLAINNTAKKVKEKEEHEIKDVFDRPTPYIQNSIFIKPSNKRNLTATVGIKDFAVKGTPATKILKAEISGGERRLKRYEKLLRAVGALPNGYFTVVGRGADKDQYGNMSRSQIVQIISYFKAFPEAGYKANATDKSIARRRKGSKKRYGISYFVGRSHDGRGQLGIWQRIHHAFGTRLKPMLIFVQSSRYEPTFDFEFVAVNTVKKEFDREFQIAIDRAIRTSR